MIQQQQQQQHKSITAPAQARETSAAATLICVERIHRHRHRFGLNCRTIVCCFRCGCNCLSFCSDSRVNVFFEDCFRIVRIMKAASQPGPPLRLLQAEEQKENHDSESQTNKVFASARRKILERIGRPLASLPGHRHTFVLVHEGGHGAWCWFKLKHLIKSSFNGAIAMDLMASGIEPSHPHEILSLEEYAKPLLAVLASIPESQKVILVGHGLGGLSVAHACEKFGARVAVAVYVGALMYPAGLEALQRLLLGTEHGEQLPWSTACKAKLSSGNLSPELLYSRSPAPDAELALSLLRPLPSMLWSTSVHTSEAAYWAVPRVYVKTALDRVFPVAAQEAMARAHVPHRNLSLASDHSPFFSAPDALNRMLLGLAQVYDP